MIKLNIACGPNIFPYPGWINYDRVDIDEYLTYLSGNPSYKEMPDHQRKLTEYLQNNGEVDFRIQDINNGFPQHKDGTVDIICLMQSIEHLNRIYEAPKLLQEFRRMLKPGGILRMNTPDLNLLLHAYNNGRMMDFAHEQPNFYRELDPSGQLAMLMFGAVGPNCTATSYEGHFFIYTKESMTQLLREAGFTNLEFYWETGKSKNPILAKESVDLGMSHSFIVEAIK